MLIQTTTNKNFFAIYFLKVDVAAVFWQLCLLFVLLYFCCGKSAGQNLLVNQPCCHSEHFTPLFYIVIAFVLLLILFVILNVVIFSLRATTLVKSESDAGCQTQSIMSLNAVSVCTPHVCNFHTNKTWLVDIVAEWIWKAVPRSHW